MLRTPWVTAKLLLVVTVIVVGALGISPALDTALAGHGGEGRLVAAGAWDVAALATATVLSCASPDSAARRPAGRAPGAPAPGCSAPGPASRDRLSAPAAGTAARRRRAGRAAPSAS